MNDIKKIRAFMDTHKNTKFTELIILYKFTELTNNESINQLIGITALIISKSMNMNPYDVQLEGAKEMVKGNVINMFTGEGKTLTSAIAAAVLAKSNEQIFIVTANDYLANRDMRDYRPFFNSLDIKTAYNPQGFDLEHKKEVYKANIIYTTASNLGFDYLRTNMVESPDQEMDIKFQMAIIDEIDSVLIDEAKTPLIISSGEQEFSRMMYKASDFVNGLSEVFEDDGEIPIIANLFGKEDQYDVIFQVSQNNVFLTTRGIHKMKEYFKEEIDNGKLNKVFHYVNQSLFARFTKIKGEDYIVVSDTVQLVDPYTGRMLIGRNLTNDLHQAVEAKENVSLSKINRTFAEISIQSLFKKFDKLAGMSGTAKEVKKELSYTYGLKTVNIKPNKPSQRIDHPNRYFDTEEEKLDAIIEEIKNSASSNRPVLVGTISVKESNYLSEKLKELGIEHQKLNAEDNELEAEIISNAGKKGAITISTNMAGRGTDIKLGGDPLRDAISEMAKEGYDKRIVEYLNNNRADLQNDFEEITINELDKKIKRNKELYLKDKEEIIELGGLYVIGTQLNSDERIDNQLRGRAGRQGEPGETVFYSSFDDNIFKPIKSIKKKKLNDKKAKHAQRLLKNRDIGIRKNVSKMDSVKSSFREKVYNLRRSIVHQNIFSSGLSYVDMANEIPDILIKKFGYSNFEERMNIQRFIKTTFGVEMDLSEMIQSEMKDKLSANLSSRIKSLYESEDNHDKIRMMERRLFLIMIDDEWSNFINKTSDIEKYLYIYQYGETSPESIYKRESLELFNIMMDELKLIFIKILVSIEGGIK